jgi:hypothetical protein
MVGCRIFILCLLVCAWATATAPPIMTAEGGGGGGGEPDAGRGMVREVEAAIELHRQYMHVQAREMILKAAKAGTDQDKRKIIDMLGFAVSTVGGHDGAQALKKGMMESAMDVASLIMDWELLYAVGHTQPKPPNRPNPELP